MNLKGYQQRYLYICSQWLAISKASNDKKMKPGLHRTPTKSSDMQAYKYKQSSLMKKNVSTLTCILGKELPTDKQC
jgi:hypothetical protein